MGIPIPDVYEGDYCPFDNPRFPPGETPARVAFRFGGIAWLNPDQPPPTKPFNQAVWGWQVSEYIWMYAEEGPYNVQFNFGPGGFIVSMSGGMRQFYGRSNNPADRGCRNLNHTDPSGYEGGSFSFAFSGRFREESMMLAMNDNKLPSFGELIGESHRLAQAGSRSTVYIK